MASTTPSASHSQRIRDYLRHKRELVEQLNMGFAPIVHALLRDLCVELRQCRPGMADALLIEMYFSGVGIDDEARTRCTSTCQHYRDDFGLCVRQHHLQLVGDDAVVTMEFELLQPLRQVVTEILGDPPPVMLRVQLHSPNNEIRDIALLNAEWLELADLEPLCAALTKHWANSLNAGSLGDKG